MRVQRVGRVEGRLSLPGDKSISHRAAIIGALALGTSKISNFSTGADCASTLSCLRQLGVEIHQNSNEVVIHGNNLQASAGVLDCGNSGSTIRMLAGVLAGTNFESELSGDHSLNSRPMRRIIEPLTSMGARIESTEGKPPLRIRGTTDLKPITYSLPVASAQVKSAILFAGLATPGRTQVKELARTRDHTERLLNGFGVNVTTSEDLTITLDGPTRPTGGNMRIPGDISSAAFFVAAAMLLPGSHLTIENVGLNPTRTQFLDVLSSWGADITTEVVESQRNEPVGVVNVKGGVDHNRIDQQRLKLCKDDIPTLIDELPMLAVVGTQIPGGIEIRDAAELRHKESDRLKTTADNLRRMGAEVEEYEDGMAVNGPTQLSAASIDSYGDHRIAMAFSIAALIADGESEIHNAECANISFPEFYTLLNSIVR